MTVEELKNYKNSLYSSLSRDLDAFEKNFILISSGILAFSVTFIKDIVKIEDATFLPILFLGWLLILISIGLMMFTFLSSVNGSNELWKIVDDFIVSDKLYDKSTVLTDAQDIDIKTKTNGALFKIKEKLKNLRDKAIWSFLLGVLLFSSFVAINLWKENIAESESKTINEITIKTGETVTKTKDSIVITSPNAKAKENK